MIEISTTLKKNSYPQNISYQEITDFVLGKKYELSLVFCGAYLSKKLNKKFRQKNYIANIMTFPLEKNCGEIFIKLPLDKNFTVQELFIHGLAHLKGYHHRTETATETMQNFEQKILKKFK